MDSYKKMIKDIDDQIKDIDRQIKEIDRFITGVTLSFCGAILVTLILIIILS